MVISAEALPLAVCTCNRARRSQPVGLHGPVHVAGLQADLGLIEAFPLQQLEVAEGAGHHGFRGRAAEGFQQVLLQASAVDPDADGDSLLAGLLDHRPDAVLAADVARIDAQAGRAAVRGHQRQAVVEVDVRHHGDGRPGADLMEDLAGLLGGNAHPDDFAAVRRVVVDLVDRRLHIPRVGLGHALHADGGVAADADFADGDLARPPPGRERSVGLIGHGASPHPV